MQDSLTVEHELRLIKERNLRVEADKAWETSGARTLCIGAMTYVSVAIVFYLIGVSNPLLNAFVPTCAFTISTRSLPFIKRWWIKKYYKRV